MSAFLEERVLSVHHWTDRLFSFTTTRDTSLRFSNGHFTMIGLKVDEQKSAACVLDCQPQLRRAPGVSVHQGRRWPADLAPAAHPGGDTIIVGKKPTGTLLIDYLLPGKNLYMIGTGTGLAPWLAVARDPETYEKFDNVVVVHGVREVKELAYQEMFEQLPEHEFLGEIVKGKLHYYPTVTREPFRNQGRITDLINDNVFPQSLGLPALNPETDRVMLCGSPAMLAQLKEMME